MGFFSDLFGGKKRNLDFLQELNPLSRMKLEEVVIADNASDHLRHYFRFRNSEGQDEEFVVVYGRLSGGAIQYESVHWRRPKQEMDFSRLNDRSPWWPAISRLIDMGRDAAPYAPVSRTHFSLQVPARASREPTGGLSSNLSTKAERPSSAPLDQLKASKKSGATQSQWQMKRGETGIDGPRPKDEFSRSYEFTGLRPPDTTATVRIECTIESAGLARGGDGSKGLNLSRSVRFYLRPFRLPREQEFVLRVLTIDESEGGEFDVTATPVDRETVVFKKFGGRNDTATLLRTLMAGKDIKFEILQDDDLLVNFPPLPNDDAFKRLWNESAERFAELESTYEILRSRIRQVPLTDARNSPDSYAVWMVEPEPAQYLVLLVRLDQQNQMEDSWQLGEEFPNRAAQGSYALELARDLGIRLMEVKGA